ITSRLRTTSELIQTAQASAEHSDKSDAKEERPGEAALALYRDLLIIRANKTVSWELNRSPTRAFDQTGAQENEENREAKRNSPIRNRIRSVDAYSDNPRVQSRKDPAKGPTGPSATAYNYGHLRRWGGSDQTSRRTGALPSVASQQASGPVRHYWGRS